MNRRRRRWRDWVGRAARGLAKQLSHSGIEARSPGKQGFELALGQPARPFVILRIAQGRVARVRPSANSVKKTPGGVFFAMRPAQEKLTKYVDFSCFCFTDRRVRTGRVATCSIS
jgi:hypothetical protein